MGKLSGWLKGQSSDKELKETEPNITDGTSSASTSLGKTATTATTTSSGILTAQEIKYARAALASGNTITTSTTTTPFGDRVYGFELSDIASLHKLFKQYDIENMEELESRIRHSEKLLKFLGEL